MSDDQQTLPSDAVVEVAEEFQDRKLSGMAIAGRCGFHTLYKWDSDDPTVALDTALHMALEEYLDQIWIEADEIEAHYGEATAETVAEETCKQIEDMTGLFGGPWAAESFEETLAKKLQHLNTYSDEVEATEGNQ